MKKILPLLLIIFSCINCIACSSANTTTTDTAINNNLVCDDIVKNSDYNDCIVQVLDMVFNLDEDDTKYATYIYDKLANSSYDFEVSASEEGLVSASDTSTIYVYYNKECLFYFTVDNFSNSTASIKDCDLSCIAFYPEIYYFQGVAKDVPAPAVPNIWYASGIHSYKSGILYKDLKNSISQYSFKENIDENWYSEKVTYIYMKINSEKKNLEMEYNFMVNNTTGTLDYTFFRVWMN